jgi:imidazoleglycerol-phosphate dehydratase
MTKPSRKAVVERATAETSVRVSLDLDGTGQSDLGTGIGFFDHMLTHLAKHGRLDLSVQAKGDLEVDGHHTVEDVGICIGNALRQALGDCKGIRRFAHAVTPMDEVLAEVSIDISGRPFLAFDAEVPPGMVGEFDAELTEEFFRALVMNARMTVHFGLRSGGNLHHVIEGLFKAFARALREAVSREPGSDSVPSTKGSLEV